ncbi:MAG: hypothetical protein M3Y29_03200, partial [Chloroflexota bacterium]|nr:hypothetical protein [Chloroflexota bacterium]
MALAALLTLVSVTPVAAAVAWTLVANPLATTTGTPTTFTLTATNLLLGQIRCLWVDVPPNFTVAGSTVSGSTAGDDWTSRVTGNRVTVWTTSGGDELGLLGSVDFAVQATPTSAGNIAWNARSFDDKECTSGS